MTNTKKSIQIITAVLFACTAMGIIDAVIQPGYATKSAIKICLFLILPIIYSKFNKETNLKAIFTADKKGILKAFSAGLGVYAIIMAAYFAAKNFFDFSNLTSSLTSTTGVNKSNFVWVALYISFVNSMLEEFFFRGFAFLELKKNFCRKGAYIFSSLAFALYHIAMMIGWFDIAVIVLAVVGLTAGGIIFNFFDEKANSIYLSWCIHLCANLATNTIGFMLFDKI